MELSVIIPIYKTEEFLTECVDSILEKADEDVEVVLVDDGSPDGCPGICDRYAEKDTRVRVVHKENGGLSSARNAGLAVATGRYVTFVDSDDKIFPDSLPEILTWIRGAGADMCFLRAFKLFADGTLRDLGENIDGAQLRAKSREEAIRHLASRSKYPGSAWAKIFRRDFLTENDLHFPYDRRYSEDLGFIRDCVLRAESFDALDVPYYQYRQGRTGSITQQIKAKNFNDLLQFITESAEKLTENKKAKDPVSGLVMSFVAYEYSILLYGYTRIPKEDKKAALAAMKPYAWTLKYAATKKGRMICWACRLFGVRFAAFLLKQYRRAVEK
jgi:glycosyltransferase involved in cell wall biosynthesis